MLSRHVDGAGRVDVGLTSREGLLHGCDVDYGGGNRWMGGANKLRGALQ